MLLLLVSVEIVVAGRWRAEKRGGEVGRVGEEGRVGEGLVVVVVVVVVVVEVVVGEVGGVALALSVGELRVF